MVSVKIVPSTFGSKLTGTLNVPLFAPGPPDATVFPVELLVTFQVISFAYCDP